MFEKRAGAARGDKRFNCEDQALCQNRIAARVTTIRDRRRLVNGAANSMPREITHHGIAPPGHFSMDRFVDLKGARLLTA